MLSKLFVPRMSRRGPAGEADRCGGGRGRIAIGAVRALATEVALATSLDTTPAAVVSLYEYAHQNPPFARARLS